MTKRQFEIYDSIVADFINTKEHKAMTPAEVRDWNRETINRIIANV